MPARDVLVTALILERPLCVPCVARSTSLRVEEALTVLTVLQRALDLHRDDSSRCRICGVTGLVFYIERPRKS